MSHISDNGINAEIPTVNRFAVVLEPTEAFLAWARECPERDLELTLEELREGCTVYLIPETDNELEVYIERNYATMFEHELDSWCMEDALWPEDRSFKEFKRFFKVCMHSIVIDLGEEPILRDSQ